MSTPTILNSSFIRQIGTDSGKQKIAASGQAWIRDQLHEDRFSSKIIPLEPVSVDELQVSPNGHDTPVKIVPIEEPTRAMTMNFRGQPSARLIEAKRVEMPFWRVSSELLNKTEEELIVYQKMNMPITKLIEKSIITSIKDIEDRTFIVHVEACVQGMQDLFNGGGGTPPVLNATSIQSATPPTEYSVFKSSEARIVTPGSESAVALPPTRPDFVNLFRMIDGRKLRANIVLITEQDFDYLLQWTAEDNGDSVQSQTLKEGWTYSKLMGRAYARTIKNDVLRPGNYYIFTAAEFLGVFNRLMDTKFWVDKEQNVIKLAAWESVGMTLVNSASIGKMETYSGDATVTDTDSIVSDVTPVAERAMGEENNQVAEGLVYPSVEHY
jgi:hypothetical protein